MRMYKSAFHIVVGQHLLSISFHQTDDCGVFKTSLSNEMKICAETYKLGEADLVELTVNANRYSFADDLERQLVADKIRDFTGELFSC